MPRALLARPSPAGNPVGGSDPWRRERRRFLEAVQTNRPGAAFHALGRVRGLAEAGAIPAMAQTWAVRRLRWLRRRTAQQATDTDDEEVT